MALAAPLTGNGNEGVTQKLFRDFDYQGDKSGENMATMISMVIICL
jgi:hypothetical protein